MFELLLLRHGKASKDDPDLHDEDRPLLPRGQEQSARMGAFLAERGLVPDRCLSSTALRAAATAVYFMGGARLALSIELRRELYHAHPEAILAEVAKATRGSRRILVVGHNPGMEELVGMVAGHPERFPTAALARIELTEARPQALGRARLLDLWRPKELFADEPE